MQSWKVRLQIGLYPVTKTGKLVFSLRIASGYVLLEEFSGGKRFAEPILHGLKVLLAPKKDRYKRDMDLVIRDATKNSIRSRMPAKFLKLQHTIWLIRELDNEIAEIEEQIPSIMDELHSLITTIHGVVFRMAAIIPAEVGDFFRFTSPDKLLAYGRTLPSTYQPDQLNNCYPHVEKRGSRYLHYALYNVTKYTCQWDSTFDVHLAQKPRRENITTSQSNRLHQDIFQKSNQIFLV